MDINELIQCLHKEYILILNNPNPESGSGSLTIKIKKDDILNNISDFLNQSNSNIRFSLNDENKTLLRHNLYLDYFYLKIPYFNDSFEIILHILPKSYTYLNDDSIFLFKADMENDVIIDSTPEYDVIVDDNNTLKAEFLQEEIYESENNISPRKAENKTIKHEDPDDFWIKNVTYDHENVIGIEEISSDIEPVILNTSKENILMIGKAQLKRIDDYDYKTDWIELKDFDFNTTDFPIEINIEQQTGFIPINLFLYTSEDYNYAYVLSELTEQEIENMKNEIAVSKKVQIQFGGDDNEYNFDMNDRIISFKQKISENLEVSAKLKFKTIIEKPNYENYIEFDNRSIEGFNQNNTPINAFFNMPSGGGNITINNKQYNLTNKLKTIKFGNDYLGVIQIENSFLRSLGSIEKIDLKGLFNVSIIKSQFCRDITIKEFDFEQLLNVEEVGVSFISLWRGIKVIDLRAMNKLTTVGNYFISDCPDLEELRIDNLNISSIGDGFLYNCPNLKKIYLGNMNWNIDLGIEDIMVNLPNTSECKLYASNQETVNTFKSKLSGLVGQKISEWTVVIE